MHTKQQSGFTLVELAVVVFLVGLLASLGLSALNAQLASSRISDTKKKQEIIKDALISYLGRNKRLPCPATDNTGVENRIADTVKPPSHTEFPKICKGNFGFVPYATLDLPKSVALDGWENFFSYAVSSQWSLTYSATIPTLSNEFVSVGTMSFNTGITGVFTVYDRLPAPSYATPSLSNKAVVILVSHGKNGFGALTSKNTRIVSPANTLDEFFNVPQATWVPPPGGFFKRDYTDDDTHPNGAFDDIMLFLNPSDFITPLAKDGALKSPESQWAEQITNINNALIGAMYTSSVCAPPADQTAFNLILSLNGIPIVDPWGGALTYAPTFCRLHNDGRWKTSSCSSDCTIGTCFTLTTSTLAFSVTTPTAAATIRPQTLTSIKAVNPTWFNSCPNS